MAVTFDVSAEVFSNSITATVDAAITTGSASNMVLVAFHTVARGGYFSGGVVFDPAGSNKAFTKIDNLNTSANNFDIAVYILKDVDITKSIAKTVRASTLSGTSAQALQVLAFTDVDQTTPSGTVVKQDLSGSSISLAVASEIGGLVVDAAFVNAVVPLVGASQTERSSGTLSAGPYYQKASTEAGDTSVAMQWSTTGGSSRYWSQIAVPIKPIVSDTTKPEVHASTDPSINVAGTQTTVVFTEAVTGDGTGFQLSGPNALTYVSGDGTDTWVFSNATIVLDGAAPTLEYDDTTGDMADLSANVLDSFTGQSVNNGSEAVVDVTAPTVIQVIVSASEVLVQFDEEVTGYTGLSLVGSTGTALTVSGWTGTGTANYSGTLSRAPISTESVALVYVPGNIEDLSSNALEAIAYRLATNNVSAVAGSGISRSRLVNQGG